MYDRVINDVYVRIGKGKKWHRVYETHLPSENPVLAPYGRSFLCPCGNAASDLFRDDDGEFYRAPASNRRAGAGRYLQSLRAIRREARQAR